MASKQITHAAAKIADVCDECSDPIWPGDDIVIYVERYRSWPKPEQFITRHYCKGCGQLLEDSLTTTGAV